VHKPVVIMKDDYVSLEYHWSVAISRGGILLELIPAKRELSVRHETQLGHWLLRLLRQLHVTARSQPSQTVRAPGRDQAAARLRHLRSGSAPG
jgi:hypothetical protein